MLLVAGAAGSACAFLPPDASAREPQIRAYRQEVRAKYEERLVARQAEAVRAYQRTQVDIFTPPWMRTQTQMSATPGEGAVPVVPPKTHERKHRFLVSFVLLIFIGAGVGWARYATRDVD
jgi:hypothetical protein